ncbi:MAG: FAD-dependent oxidoreductase, partial [Acidobacteria bacterium]|nr:FAD-dependent oxidoreductase [Acidobacteriota bacterium]
MAGRNIGVTHAALGTVRVMRTTGMMGEVVGMAAAVARRHNATPRAVYRNYLEELKQSLARGAGKAR